MRPEHRHAESQSSADGREARPASRHPERRLGPFLCWAIVFADLGTSVYYTPGILFAQPAVGPHAALFVGMTLVVFVLLTRKYGEVAVRYPEGGGVVTVAGHAIHPFAGLMGGMFILVDYFLTAALSALSGIIYLSDVAPQLHPLVLQVTLAAIVVLGALNLIGISESARVNAAFATAAAASQLAVVVAVVAFVGFAGLWDRLPRVLSGPTLTPVSVLTGYAGAFLAFSGLESISQLSPAMAEPRARTTRVAMGAVIGSMALTSPLLTLWSTTILPITAKTDPNQVISLLAGYVSGRALEVEVAVTGALLLVFACNTALIGSYHVFLALAKMGFIPRVIEQRNRWRQTPHWAILTVVTVPLLILVLSKGSVSILGDLYAFGLLGAFSLTCLSLDFVRWHERHPERSASREAEGGEGVAGEGAGRPPVGRVTLVVGIVTTGLVSMAWITNLFAKPLATLFGGGVTVGGLLIALVSYRLAHRRRPLVFPVLHRPGYRVAFLHRGRRARPPAMTLAVLPHDPDQLDPVMRAVEGAAAGGPVVLLQRGTAVHPPRPLELLEVRDPYLEDPQAQEVFRRAAQRAREAGLTYRYVYVPSTAGPEAVGELWRTLQPRETVAAPADEDLLSAIPAGEVRRETEDGLSVLHYYAGGAPRGHARGSS